MRVKTTHTGVNSVEWELFRIIVSINELKTWLQGALVSASLVDSAVVLISACKINDKRVKHLDA